ncbi:MAG: glycoside hydrolase, partial [Candidatus Symbiothrix sp.]|nr:glycoside hydrolase [Candidatus Symbiothrix sp.]
YFRGVREISDQMLAAGKGSFASLSVQCGDAQALGVQCGEEIFVYVFNPEKEILVSDLTIETKENKSYNVQSYEPTFRLYKDVRKVAFTSTQIVLEDFSLGAQKEMVLLLKPV